jgi:hypothetical protein
MENIKTFIMSADLIAEVPSARLHFGKSSSHKTVIGGICTMIISFIFLWLAITQGIDIWNKNTPYTSSVEGPAEYDSKMRLN